MIGAASFLVASLAVAASVDGATLRRTGSATWDDPVRLLVVVALFGLAFVVRAVAWTRVLPELSFTHALAGIHLAFGANHVLPLRLGEPFRVISVVRRGGVGFEAASASTVALRAADIVAVVGVGALLAPSAFVDLVGSWGWLVVAGVVVAGLVGLRWLIQVQREGSTLVRLPGLSVMVLTTSAWLMEACLVWQSAQWAGLDVSARDAVLVTTVAVAAQALAIAPSGFGTYEAASVAAYATLGHDPETALAAALTAHAIKTVYSLVVGAIALISPQPTMIGRLRLARDQPPSPPDAGASADHSAPIVLFMPALNEEAAVGACIRRAPAEVDGHRVRVLVIDDGSTDRTAEVARQAGAEVISFDSTRGLGAGVRFGLHHAAASGAAAVAFCDADEEYPPEELAKLVRPILAGEADYVVGSRFAGTIQHMRPHRRLGNMVLTKILSFIGRRHISDGQSGYRAFSPAAAADAEVIHDFNYAQVVTLDLLAKGYRYAEVPITYRFRTTGDSFIKLGHYLRRVLPAIYVELNNDERRQQRVA